MERISEVETGISGNSPDDFPATLLPDFKGITMEEREAQYQNWHKRTLIAKVAILEKQIEDDDIGHRAALQRYAEKIALLEDELHFLRESTSHQFNPDSESGKNQNYIFNDAQAVVLVRHLTPFDFSQLGSLRSPFHC